MNTPRGRAPDPAGTESCLGSDRPLAQPGRRTCRPGPPPRPTRATVFGKAGLWAPQQLHFRASSLRPQHRPRHDLSTVPGTPRRAEGPTRQHRRPGGEDRLRSCSPCLGNPQLAESSSSPSPERVAASPPHTSWKHGKQQARPRWGGGRDPTAVPGGLDVGAPSAGGCVCVAEHPALLWFTSPYCPTTDRPPARPAGPACKERVHTARDPDRDLS